jgi:hypothetical protein
VAVEVALQFLLLDLAETGRQALETELVAEVEGLQLEADLEATGAQEREELL